MEKYSVIYLKENEEHFGFRYNYEESVLEYVSKWDCKLDENGNLIDRILPEWEIVDRSD